MKQDPYWFFKKWGIPDQSLLKTVEDLENKYESLLMDIKRLEEESIETTNTLYEIENRLQTKIDTHCPPIYNLDQYSLGEK